MPDVNFKKFLLVIGLVAVLVLGTLTAVAVATNPDHAKVTRTTTAFDHSVMSGELQQMLARHQAMMEQMRVNTSPAMLRMMDADPMWRAMRTGAFTKMMEAHQKELDRMLGRDR